MTHTHTHGLIMLVFFYSQQPNTGRLLFFRIGSFAALPFDSFRFFLCRVGIPLTGGTLIFYVASPLTIPIHLCPCRMLPKPPCTLDARAPCTACAGTLQPIRPQIDITFYVIRFVSARESAHHIYTRESMHNVIVDQRLGQKESRRHTHTE